VAQIAATHSTRLHAVEGQKSAKTGRG
jgi:hypothetical protein